MRSAAVNTLPVIALTAPPIETLLARNRESLWPKDVLHNPSLVCETSLRTRLLAFLRNEDTSNHMDVYLSLADFLDADPLHRRIVLYLPFELLPPHTPEYQQFISSYMRAWHVLLHDRDVRANFMDGNILEPELAPYGQPTVVKATHLIPFLAHKGYLSQTEIETLTQTDDSFLRENVKNAILSVPFFANKPYTCDVHAFHGVDSLHRLAEILECEQKKIAMRAVLNEMRKMPQARIAWETKDKKEKLIERVAQTLVDMIGRHRTTSHDALSFLSLYANQLLPYTAIRWFHKGIIAENELASRRIVIPNLDPQFQSAGVLAETITKFTPITETLAANPEYQNLIYPIALFFGSRLKGYALSDADLDVAVFIKPDVPFSKRGHIQHILRTVFSDASLDRHVVEFWLERHNDILAIRNFENPDIQLADETWIHILLGSVWLGEKETVQHLYHTLLTPLLFSSCANEQRNVRAQQLSAIEREVLQYRLMHKGYSRLFPIVSCVPPQAIMLDPKSAFWDSGYRHLATRLFLSRVFLPQLKKVEKSSDHFTAYFVTYCFTNLLSCSVGPNEQATTGTFNISSNVETHSLVAPRFSEGIS